MTLEPGGTATGCNPVEVGSTPTGVSDCPTAGSDYIFLLRSPMSEPIPRWMVITYYLTASRDYIHQTRNVSATTSLGVVYFTTSDVRGPRKSLYY